MILKPTRKRIELKLGVLIFLVVLLTVTIFFDWNKRNVFEDVVFPESIKEVVSVRDSWREQIHREGSSNFYERLKDNYTKSTIQHSVAHVFGELLYEVDGLSGISVCDESFFYGCFHAFMARAVAENGLETLKEINEYCLKKFGVENGCQHGLGHAVVQYRGLNSLSQALEDCSKFEVGSGSCMEGAFMEFNLPTVEGAGGVDVSVREVVNGDYYYPCFSVREDSRDECFFELPRWWMRVEDEDLVKVGQLCERLSLKDKSFCFRAVGQQIDLHEIKVIREGCELMPSRYAKGQCLIGASWGVFSWPNRGVESLTVCDGLSEAEKEECPSITEVKLGHKKR